MDSLEKALYCARCADDTKAQDLVILELKEISSLADYFIICNGTSDRQVRAIADHIAKRLTEIKAKPLGVEGQREGTWILMDCDDVIIHVFQEQDRRFYDLENLWTDCPRVPFEAVSSK